MIDISVIEQAVQMMIAGPFIALLGTAVLMIVIQLIRG